MTRALTAAAIMLAAITAAQAAPKIKKWVASIPPLEYDYPYEGKLTIVRGDLATMNEKCAADKWPGFPYPFACSVAYYKVSADQTQPGISCTIYIAEDALLRGWVYADVLRHEMGHCNGWRGHDGQRNPPAMAGRKLEPGEVVPIEPIPPIVWTPTKGRKR